MNQSNLFRVGCRLGVVLGLALVAVACGEDARSLPGVELEEEGEEGGGLVESCEPGDARECSVTLAEHNGVLSCFDGMRVCRDNGKWGQCGSGTVVSIPAPSESSAKRLQALTTTEECDGNPCDPTCRAFTDVPDAAGAESSVISTSPYDWVTGSSSSLPKGLVSKGFNEPCSTGSDCQFNTRCVNPSSGECTHDKCESGEGLDPDCDTCVDEMCDVYPECCIGYTGVCSHDLGEEGEALIESCSECTEAICAMPAFAYCCDRQNGSWDDACVAEVSNTCGATLGCCDGETAYNGSCYKLNTTGAKWADARTSCQQKSGWDLVSIESSAENAVVYNLNVSNDTWIGLTSGNGVSTGDDWKWANGDPSGTWKESTRSGHPYNGFTTSEPSSTDDCARMVDSGSGTWDGRGCTSSYDYVCEGPPSCIGGTPTIEQPAACTHDPCQTGAALKSDCDQCVQNVCATKPSCCSTSGAWDSTCVAAVATSCTSIASCGCASGESSYNGHCYKVNSTTATWANALTSCRSQTGWDLVSIGSSGENSFIAGLIGSNHTWIGLTESTTYGGANNKWVWTNGDPSGSWTEGTTGGYYRKWTSGEPNGTGPCARMSRNTGGEWNDRDCSTAYQYICEASSGNTLSATTPVVLTAPEPTFSIESYGDGSDISEWSDECVAQVDSVCDVSCNQPEDQGSGVCLPWYPGQVDETCSGVDLAAGIPCEESIPVCNHGTQTAPSGIRIVHFPANSQQYPSCAPDQTHPQMFECFTEEEIPPGECIDVTTCPKLIGNREIMVNPEGDDYVDECSCRDNWTLYSGGSCGPPVCSGGSNVATMEKLPIDVIVSIDNSKSMQGEIVAIQQRINDDFADILEASGLDYRVIMVSRYGNVYTENYDSGNSSTSAYSICVGSPLSTLTCPASSAGSTPKVAHNAPKFYHHSTDIGSNDMWCKLTDSFDTSDPYPTARSGFTPIATSGWGAYLREDAYKVFVGITDDSPATGTGAGVCATSTGFTNNSSGASKFDQAIRTLSPEHFGAYNSADPSANRNYVWYSIVGMAGNAVSNPTPLEPSEATVSKCCKGDGTSTSSCPGNFGAVADGAGNGVGYQELSKTTGGLRFSSCYNSNFNDVFNAIAEEVVEGASVSCDFTLQNEGSFDIDTAKVYFQEGENANPELLEQVANAAACTADGWYQDPDDAAKLTLCPEACAEAQESDDSRLSVEVGCLGSGYEAYTFSEVYSADCRFDQVPQWGFLSVDTTMIDDANVVLSARSAATQSELATADYVTLATLSVANGNVDCSSPVVDGCPLDLYTLLAGAPLVHQPYIEIQATMNPTGDQSALPVIDEWSISFSCIDDE